MKKSLQTDKAPQAIGPYSQGIEVGNLLFLSGQIPLDPKAGTLVGTSIEEQTGQVLKNIHALLEARGKTPRDVVKTTVFLKNFSDFPKFNEVYGEFFVTPFPARSTVGVSELPKGALVEIECIVAL